MWQSHKKMSLNLYLCQNCVTYTPSRVHGNTKRGNEKRTIDEGQAIQWQKKMTKTKTNTKIQQITNC